MILNFQSPSSLNQAKEARTAKSHLWTHAEYKGFDNGILELNLENWEIYCSDQNISGHISDWMVNEADYTMKLNSEKTKGNFKSIDYPFAVSMLGQLVSSQKLIQYLKGLQEIYDITVDTNSHKSIDDNE